MLSSGTALRHAEKTATQRKSGQKKLQRKGEKKNVSRQGTNGRWHVLSLSYHFHKWKLFKYTCPTITLSRKKVSNFCYKEQKGQVKASNAEQ